MPFRKVNPEEEIKKAIEKNPELEELIIKDLEEYEEIKVGRLNKKFEVD